MEEYQWLIEALVDLQCCAAENNMPKTATMFSEAITLASIDIQMKKLAEAATCEGCRSSVLSALDAVSAIMPIPLPDHGAT